MIERYSYPEMGYIWTDENEFKDIKQYLTPAEIEHCFEYSYYLRHVATIMARFGL